VELWVLSYVVSKLFGDPLGSPDVPLLRGLVPTGQHDDQNAASACEVQAVARPKVNPHFRYLIADGSPISQVPGLGLTKAGRDAYLASPIRQLVEPRLEFLREADRIHTPIVAKWIQKRQGGLGLGHLEGAE
jgi:hypothetical protein